MLVPIDDLNRTALGESLHDILHRRIDEGKVDILFNGVNQEVSLSVSALDNFYQGNLGILFGKLFTNGKIKYEEREMNSHYIKDDTLEDIMKWKVEGQVHTGEEQGWVPYAFEDAAVFRYGQGLYGWDLKLNKKLWHKDLLDDASYGNKQSTACGGYYITFSAIKKYNTPAPIYAVDPLSGETVWRTLVEVHCAGFEEGITASEDAIFFHGRYEPTQEWNLVKLDPQTGEQIWKKPGLSAKQLIWQDEHLFFGGNQHLFVMNDEGEIIKKFDKFADGVGWQLTPGADHTMLAGYADYAADRWNYWLIDTRTFEVLGELVDTIGNIPYIGGRARGHFAAIDNKRIILFDVLNGRQICEQFTDEAIVPLRAVSTPYGYAVLYNDDETNHAHIAFLDEITGEITENLELDGRATELFWLGGRLVVFYFWLLYLLTPEE